MNPESQLRVAGSDMSGISTLNLTKCDADVSGSVLYGETNILRGMS